MPTYEYQCTRCNRVFEVFQSITAKPLRVLDTGCAECDDHAPVQRLIGAGAGVIFKGSGFYETDYRSESYKKGAKAETASAADTSGKSDSSKQQTPKKTQTAAKPAATKKTA